MRYDSLWPNALALSAFLLAACGDNTTTEPTQTPQPGPSVPELDHAGRFVEQPAD